MSGSGRLSLRARLLVLLIGVTAAFLLVLGAVSVVVLSSRLGGQFDADLVAAAQHAPQQIPAGYAAVEITLAPVSLQPLTGDSAATRELATWARERVTAGRPGQVGRAVGATALGRPFLVRLPGQPRLRAVAELVRLSAGRRAVVVVARPPGAVANQVRSVLVAELITGGGLLLLLALGGRWLIGRGLAPLRQMATTAHQITTRGDLTARMPDADVSTEVGRLGWAINTMLDRIQQAFGARLRSERKVRQFAADASHELRTPLTTIRGYAELHRQGALGPEHLPDAMRRIEQEADRMSRLVAELLELARLDRTSSLDLAETDLTAVVNDAVADARAVEPGRPVHAQAPQRLFAVVDEARIRQVLANLIGNVREHTPADTPVAVLLAQAGDGVVLEVNDAGPGMSAEDAARAFDRFHRSRPSNGSGGGSGLGLSIVQAIAQAHGGQAALESAPGQGTRVRIRLPTMRQAGGPKPAAPPTAAARWRGAPQGPPA